MFYFFRRANRDFIKLFVDPNFETESDDVEWGKYPGSNVPFKGHPFLCPIEHLKKCDSSKFHSLL